MSATRATRQLFDAGEYGRILEETRLLHLDRGIDPDLAVLIAHASFEAGAPQRAQSLASAHIESSHPVVRARAQLVLALCLRAGGQVTEARRLHQASIRSADESADDELQAWTALHMLRHLIISAPRNVGAAMLPSVRVRALRSGSARAAAYLHATVAIGEGQAGRIDEAQRHCRLAKDLVSSAPHAWLNCSVLGVTAAISLAACDFAEAVACLNQLQQLADDHGLIADRTRANVNVGHLAVVTGDYPTAERALTEVLGSALTSRIAKLTAADGLARVLLAQGRLAECDALLQTIERDAADDVALAHVLGVQSAIVTRARLLVKSGDARAAVVRLDHLRRNPEDTLDRPLMASAHMTAAQALVMDGHVSLAARHLAASLAMHPMELPELQGQFSYSAALAIAGLDADLATALRYRARRLWTLQGMGALEREFVQADEPSSAGNDDLEGLRPTPPVIVDALSSLLALAGKPELLVQELQHTIRLLDCCPDVRLLRASDLAGKPGETLELVVPLAGTDAVKLACALPQSPDKVLTLGAVLRVGELALELERLRESERRRAALWPERTAEAAAGVICESDLMRDVLTVARRIADTTVPVLITGETGTGKEVVARLIHSYSKRSKASFVPFNCTSMSRDLIESQLFGHRRGSFTGATEHSQGVIRAANHGTLLLDEIGDMPMHVQPKLLRFLESEEIHPIGEPHPLRVDVRVVAATNADLKTLVEQGEFREDLYYRLSIVPIHLPPLRDRRSEIPSLAIHYLDRYAREFRKGDLRLAEETVDYLVTFRWPGNVRQLANEMRRVAAMAEVGAVVMPEHLREEMTKSPMPLALRLEPRTNEVLVRIDQPLPAAVEHLERIMIANALKRTGGLVEPAAQLLGLSRKGLYLKRQRYQIIDPLDTASSALSGDD